MARALLLPLAGLLLRPRWTLHPVAVLLWAVILGQLAAYVFAYLIGPVGPLAVVPNTFGRLLLHVLPAAVLLTGHYWRAMGRGERRHESAD